MKNICTYIILLIANCSCNHKPYFLTFSQSNAEALIGHETFILLHQKVTHSIDSIRNTHKFAKNKEKIKVFGNINFLNNQNEYDMCQSLGIKNVYFDNQEIEYVIQDTSPISIGISIVYTTTYLQPMDYKIELVNLGNGFYLKQDYSQ
jgi:hypothetical protein